MKTNGPIYKPTTSSAVEFANADRLEEWIHLFLCKEGGNKEFSDGLKLKPRRYYAPRMMNLDEFERCCGPETNIKYQIPKDGFNHRVGNISEKYSSGDWDMPPLIIYRDENGYELSDGNHRYEALKRLGHKQYWVIIWETVK
jgi:hypothetical protein